MRNGNEHKYMVKSAVLGMAIPFVLFWIGVFVPAFVDGMAAFFLCLVPYYGYMTVLNCFLESSCMRENDEKMAECDSISGFWAVSRLFCFLTSFLCLVDVDKSSVFYYPSIVMMVNFIPSGVFMLFAGYDHGTRFARPLLYW